MTIRSVFVPALSEVLFELSRMDAALNESATELLEAERHRLKVAVTDLLERADALMDQIDRLDVAN